MEWRGRRQSDNIEDRRGQSSRGGFGRNPFGRSGIQIPMGGRRGGGLSFGTIIFLVVIYFVLKAMGIDMLQVLGEGNVGGAGSGYEQSIGQRPAGQSSDDTTAFVRTVLAETETTWNAIFSASGEQYREPTLVLFRGAQPQPAVRHRLPPVPSIVPPTARSIWTPSSSINSSGSSMRPAILHRPM